MTQTTSSRKTNHKYIPLDTIKNAISGDSEAMMIIQQHYDPLIRRLATVKTPNGSYLDVDLYDRLKTRLIIATLKFTL